MSQHNKRSDMNTALKLPAVYAVLREALKRPDLRGSSASAMESIEKPGMGSEVAAG